MFIIVSLIAAAVLTSHFWAPWVVIQLLDKPLLSLIVLILVMGVFL